MLAGAEGLEPPTIGFGDRCSTNSNYTPKQFFKTQKPLSGALVDYAIIIIG